MEVGRTLDLAAFVLPTLCGDASTCPQSDLDFSLHFSITEMVMCFEPLISPEVQNYDKELLAMYVAVFLQ